MKRAIFVTGTDTGVGKTVLTVLLISHLRRLGIPAIAVKPFCSGGREDAEAHWKAQGGEFGLDDLNPWYFDASLTPLLAARRERRSVPFEDVVQFLRRSARGREFLLVEGAGGLLSPLGEGYSARELISELRAIPIIVCQNRLGVLNHVLLVVRALTGRAGAAARVVLMQPPHPDPSSSGNPGMLREILGADRVFVLPHFPKGVPVRPGPRILRILEDLAVATIPRACPAKGAGQG